MASRDKSDLRRRCLLALFLVLTVLLLLAWGGRQLGQLLTTDDARQLDIAFSKWLDGNYSAGHAWRGLADGNKTFLRLSELPSARVLRTPQLRGGRSSGHGSWIVQSDGFLKRGEAASIIGWAEGRFKMGATASNKMYDKRVRNSSVAWCHWRSACGASGAVKSLLSRVEGATGIGRAHYEDLQIVRYFPGEFYREHMDVPAVQRFSTRGGFGRKGGGFNPRILTAFVYLSDVPEGAGGETAFTKLVQHGVPPVQPKLGRLLVWPNVWIDEPAIADKRMYHEARELHAGVKYGANIWIRLTRGKGEQIRPKGQRGGLGPLKLLADNLG